MTTTTAPPRLIAGQYEVRSLLGEGAFGRVWRVKDKASDRDLALKEIKPRDDDGGGPAQGSDEVAVQVEQEFVSLAKLQHPNIVKVFDYGVLRDEAGQGERDGRYIVMELVPGRDLSSLIEKGPLAREEALRILAAVGQALDLMHARLFVHCDIKSENVRIMDDGTVKLMDFGLLHQLGTASTQVRGTVQYMAPEMFTGGVIDGRTDLYSLGILAYEMLTGQLPFQGATHAEILGKHMREKPRPPSDLVDMPDELEALILQLIEKAPAARVPSARVLVKRLAAILGEPLDAGSVSHRTSYLYSAEIVGRDEQSQFLDDVRERLGRSEGSSIFIGGRAGEGKSRLLAEFSLKVRLAGRTWCVGRCQKEGLAPLSPIVEALTVLVGRTPDAILKPHGDVLSLILPGLKDKGFTPPVFATPALAKMKLHEAVSAWLADLSRAQPFILCIEDVHWADGGTLEMLNHLVRTRGDAPIVYVATFRSDEVERTSVIYATIDDGTAINLALRPLARRDVAKLLTSTLAAHTLPDEFVADVFKKTGGNAFFLVETMRWLVESGLLQHGETGWQLGSEQVELPETIAEVVARRLKLVPEDLLAFLRALTPMGLALDAALAGAVTKSTTNDLVKKLDALVERQFVQRISGRFFFTHQTVRDAVYASIPAAALQALHLAYAETLENNAKKDKGVAPASLAFHFKRAAQAERAIPYFLDAGKSAASTLQLVEATRLLSEGAELAELSTKKDKDTTLIAFYDALVPTAFSGHTPTAVKAAARLWEIWGKTVDPQKVIADQRAGKGGGIGGFFKKLVAPTKPGPFDPATKDPALIVQRMLQVKSTQCKALSATGQPEASLAEAEKILPLLDEGSPVRGALNIARGIAFTHLGRYQELHAAALEAIEIFEHAEVPPNLRWDWVQAYYFRGLSKALQGLPVGREEVQRGLDIADQYELLDAKGFALWGIWCRATLAGIPDDFEAYLAEVSDLLRRSGYPRLLDSRTRIFQPIYYLDRGQFELAHATTDKIEQLGKVMNDQWLLTYVDVYRGVESMETGKLEEAEASLVAAVARSRERKLGRMNTALCALGQTLTARGDLVRARAALEEVLQRATSKELLCCYDEILARRLLADATPPDEGKRHVETAIELAAQTQNPVQEGMAWYARAQLAKRTSGEVDRASLDRARTLFESIKNEHWVRRTAAAAS